MGKTTFSGPVRVGAAQKTTEPQVAGSLKQCIVAGVDIAAAVTTDLTRNAAGSETANINLPIILPPNTIITSIYFDEGSTGGSNASLVDIGWIEVGNPDGNSYNTDGIVDGVIALNDISPIFPFATNGGADLGMVMSASYPVKLTGGTGGGNDGTTGVNSMVIEYFVWDYDLNSGDGSAD